MSKSTTKKRRTKTLEECLNPAVRKGDKIFVIKARNGNINIEGKEVIVVGDGAPDRGARRQKVNFSAMSETGQIYNLYYSNPSDEFVMANADGKLNFFYAKIRSAKKEIKELERKIEFTEKFPTQKDFVAHQLNEIINTASGKGELSAPKLVEELLDKLEEEKYL